MKNGETQRLAFFQEKTTGRNKKATAYLGAVALLRFVPACIFYLFFFPYFNAILRTRESPVADVKT
jgi:hypothetical protein